MSFSVIDFWQRLTTPSQTMSAHWWPHALLLGVIGLLSIHFISLDVKQVYQSDYFRWVHLIFLPFHEAGHLLFGMFGQFLGSLGGTLGQLIIPLIFCYAFYRHRHDTFATAVCAWWFALNCLDIAPYIADARAGVLPLLGGNFGHSAPYGFHDWHYLLNETGLLAYDKGLATACMWLGRIMIIGCNYWLLKLLVAAK